MPREPDIFANRRGSITSPKSARFRRDLIESAYIRDDRRKHDREDESRRRYERAEIDTEAKLRAPARVGVDARVHNLSAGGCCLELHFGSFVIGETVWFKVEGVENWKGSVRWIDGKRIGVEFDQPFYPAVFEHIVSSNRAVELERAA